MAQLARRPWFWLAMCVAVAGLGARARPVVPQRTVQVSYIARIQHLPATAGEVQVWVPLATTGDGQQILRRDVQAPVPYEVTRDPVYGNEMLHARMASPVPSTVELQVAYDVVVEGGNRLADGAAGEPPLSPAARAQYLQAERLTVIDETVRRMAAEAVAGRRTALDRARGIYAYVIRHMRYDKSAPGWGRGDVARACAIGRGNCTDFHSLFIAMARAAGIPARFKIGAAIPDGSVAEPFGYHCWAEFYLPGHGWIPVDASEAWKHPEQEARYFGTRDVNKLAVSLGRDLQLVPAQRSGPVNIFVKPYVEVDGQPFEDVEMRFQLVGDGSTKEGRT